MTVRSIFSNRSSFLPALIISGMMASCNDKADDPKKNEENELITTIQLHLTGPEGMVMAKWRDLSPDDEAGRTIDTLYLKDSTLYTGYIELLDESKSPSVNVGEEVRAEAADHLFLYDQVPISLPPYFNVKRTDKDANNLETGLNFTLETFGLSGKTSLNVRLKHQPGVKDGTALPGDTDLDIQIPVIIRP
jgi:hypothetical protein